MSSVLIKLDPSLTIAALGELRHQFVDALDADEVSLDISEISQLDTAAVQFLAAFCETREKAGKRVDWIGTNSIFDEVLNLLGMGYICDNP